jgi:hypothetical protein
MTSGQRRVTKREEAKARAILQRANDQRQAEENAEKQLLIGRCFKYHNGYSADDKWWLYAVVSSVDDGRIMTSQFQLDSLGTLTISANTYAGLLPHGGWTPIAREEFIAAMYRHGGAALRMLTDAEGHSK